MYCNYYIPEQHIMRLTLKNSTHCLVKWGQMAKGSYFLITHFNSYTI